MSYCFVALNGKYIHTSLALRSIKGYVEKEFNLSFILKEYTINQPVQALLKDLYTTNSKAYFFSCYIWNIEYIIHLASLLAKIHPQVGIYFGGPEVTYRGQELLSQLPFLSGVLVGEGEVVVGNLLTALEKSAPLDLVAGLELRGEKAAPTPLPNLDNIPFLYNDIGKLEHRILYYESMRGCPFSCSYCLSSVERGVRFKSLPQVKEDLRTFLKAKPKQVKFVDRTFNCNLSRSEEIWAFLIKENNGVTNFHFELAGDLLEPKTIQLLATAPPGLFQFEIGVQSVNQATLKEIQRTTNLDKLEENVKALQKAGNIHLHLDLIAGLPFENYGSFIDSFHWVHALQPHQFQLGFLKVLSGSLMERSAKNYQLEYDSRAPYEVLSTAWLSYAQLQTLKTVEHMVDTYRNSGRFTKITNALLAYFQSPFDFYLKLGQYYTKAKGAGPLSKLGYYEILGSFMEENHIPLTPVLKALCRYDIFCHEKPGKYPTWAVETESTQAKGWIQAFYQTEANIQNYFPSYKTEELRRLQRITHVEILPLHPETGEEIPTAVVVNYSNRDIVGLATRWFLPVKY